MTWTTVFIFLFVVVLVCIYFMPYKKLKGKIFKKLYPDTSPITAVSFTKGNFSVSFERDGEHWNIISPAAWQADTAKMRKLMIKLSEFDVEDRFSDANPDDQQYAIGSNGVLDLAGEGIVSTVISFGAYDESGSYIYATKSGDADILLVNAMILSVLPSGADDFKRRLLFEEIYSNIASVEAILCGKGYLMVKTNAGWIMNGKNVFDEKARPLVESLLNIQAEHFANAGTKLPPKHEGLITVKAADKAVSRYFFTLPEYEDEYLVPMEGEILIINKSAVDNYFSL